MIRKIACIALVVSLAANPVLAAPSAMTQISSSRSEHQLRAQESVAPDTAKSEWDKLSTGGKVVAVLAAPVVIPVVFAFDTLKWVFTGTRGSVAGEIIGSAVRR